MYQNVFQNKKSFVTDTNRSASGYVISTENGT